jgi:hypothetical protein
MGWQPMTSYVSAFLILAAVSRSAGSGMAEF